VSDAPEILSSGGLVRFDGLLLRLDHELWPWAGAVSCLVGLCKTEAPGMHIHHINRGFGSRDENWGPCSLTLCGAAARLVLVMVTIQVRS
jgi:hypothetical protein